MTFQIPAVRGDLTLRPSGDERFPWNLEDPLLRVRLPLDAFGHKLIQQMEEPTSPVELHASLNSVSKSSIEPSLLYRYIFKFQRLGLLEGLRAKHNRRSQSQKRKVEAADVQSMPLSFVPGLQHACQACGSCCSSTDVGPIDKKQAERIQTHDWTEIIGGLDSNQAVFRTARHADKTIILTEMRNDQCIFLAEDKLCLVHRHLGIDSKPTQCRQFPYVFSITDDRIDVSLSMECRAYWKAKKAGTPPSGQQEMLRELIELGAPIHRISSTVFLDSGLLLSRADYLQLEEAMLQAVTKPSTHLSPIDPVVAMLKSGQEAFSLLRQPIDSEESRWIDAENWASMFSCPTTAFRQDSTHHQSSLADILRAMTSFCEQARVVAKEKNLNGLGMRFHFLEDVCQGALGGIDMDSFGWTDLESCRQIVQDIVASGLFAKTVPRVGAVQFGAGVLGLRAYLTVIGACYRARQACRVNVSVQDLIDSMVTLSKMLREEAVIEFLRDYEQSLFQALGQSLVHNSVGSK